MANPIVLTVEKTKFIDSVNYMPMQLSMLLKAFSLKDTSDKDTFSHLFNTIENQSYVELILDVHYYSPDTMSMDEREQFLAWRTVSAMVVQNCSILNAK